MERYVNYSIKKVLVFLLAVILAGCATVRIPGYIQDSNPYKRQIYSPYDVVFKSALKSLEELGWEVEASTNPAVYERSRELDNVINRQILIISKIKELPLVAGTRYARVNIYLSSGPMQEKTEVEIRYLTVNSVGVKSFYDYKHDAAVEKIFEHIEKNLN